MASSSNTEFSSSIASSDSVSAAAHCLMCNDVVEKAPGKYQPITPLAFNKLTELLDLPPLRRKLDSKVLLHELLVTCSPCAKISDKYEDLGIKVSQLRQEMAELQRISKQEILKSFENEDNFTEAHTRKAREIMCARLNLRTDSKARIPKCHAEEVESTSVSTHIIQEEQQCPVDTDNATPELDAVDNGQFQNARERCQSQQEYRSSTHTSISIVDQDQDPLVNQAHQAESNGDLSTKMSTRESRPKRKSFTTGATAAATSLDDDEPRRVLRKRVRISYELDHDENRDDRKQLRISNIINDKHPSPCSGTVYRYTCPECGIGFKNAGILTRHRPSHSKTYKHFCQDCNKYLRFEGMLETHKRFHNGKGGYQCAKCNHVFKNQYYLDRHDRNIHTNRPCCKVCKMNVRSKGLLMVHKMFHEGRGGFQCSECKQIFNQKRSLFNHTQAIHKGIKSVKSSREA